MSARMTVAVACDHAGLELKGVILGALADAGHEVLDLGTHGPESVDYPYYACLAGNAVRSGRADRAILVCGTGQGMAMAANAMPGIRCAICADPFSARMTRAHNDANILALGSRVVGMGLALEILAAWMGTDFEGGRHARRVDKIDAGAREETT